MTDPELTPIVAALNAERYGPSLWWKAPPKEWPPRRIEVPDYDNSEATCKHRRLLMAADFKGAREGAA